MDLEQQFRVEMTVENSILEVSNDGSGLMENSDQRNTGDRNSEENIFYEANTERSNDINIQGVEPGTIHPEFMYNEHDESIFDDENVFPSLNPEAEDIVKFDESNPELINHATLKALIVQLTSPEVIDYNLICDFFLTYRIFVDSEKVMNMLLIRLIWSLQYINSNNEASINIGKLVLLRTFVVLRHWMLNYFVDDFDSNNHLCDIFTYNMNQITNESNLVTDDMFFEQKVLKDLKIHWISLLNEFWNVEIDLDIVSDDILQYRLPMIFEISNAKKLSKSNTEMSIHTNASYRRSAMLSLYDPKIQHKCLIFGTNGNDENPQLSVNNLLLHHQSSRLSVNTKLQELKDKKLKDVTVERKPLTSNTKHNHMNLQDSSLGLKKTSQNKQQTLEETQAGVSTPIKNKENINFDNKLSPIKMVNIGFSTNGNVKLPSSKVTAILPPTPVKKMDYVIKQTNVNDPSHKPNHYIKDGKTTDDALSDFGRKKSLKKFVDGWKKSFNHNSSNINHASHATNNSQGSKDMNNLIKDAMNVMSENDEEEIGDRVDVLCARAVDELEYLIRYYVGNDSPSTIIERDIDGIEENNKRNTIDEFVDVTVDENREDNKADHYDDESIDIMASPAKKPRVTSTSHSSPVRGKIENIDDNEDSSAIDINDLSELNLKKIDNLINTDEINYEEQRQDKEHYKQRSHTPVDQIFGRSFDASNQSSFQRPASINWNDEGDLDLEYSENKTTGSVDDFDDEPKSPINQDQSFNIGSQLPPDPHYVINNQSSKSFESSISTPSNITQYNAEVADLGIALSPHLMKNNSVRRISFNEANLTKNNSNRKRMSTLSKNSSGSIFRKDSRNSAKSYISYDSAFSISKGSATYKNNELDNGELKKKTAYTDLRTVAGINDQRPALDSRISIESMSMGSYLSRSSSLRKSVRLSTLCALTELPFGEHNASNISTDRRIPSIKKELRQLDISDSSFFSIAARSKTNSVMAYNEQTQNSHNSSSNSVVIPGISNFVLKELADIPDESFQQNSPLDHALYKLEGKKSNSSDPKDETKNDLLSKEVSYVENANESNIIPDNTQDILNEINNANTQDIDDYPSDIVDMTQERPLTPVKNMMVVKSPQKKKARGSLKKNESIFFVSNGSSPRQFPSPKTILNGYYISTDILSIEKVMETDSHISFLLSYDSKSLADHFTVIERDILQEIDWKELIELKWNKELIPVNSWLEIIVNDNYFHKNKGVNLVIARFNLMVNWIISEIVMSKTQLERISIISRLIHIAHNCYVLQNFSTLMQIILGLTSEKVLKLKETWKNLPPGDILILKNLEELSSPLKNFLNIRLCINHIKPSNGCIPFVGLYLSDLIFNAERPAFIKTKIPHAAKNNDTTGGDSTLNTQNIAAKMINFSRFRTSVQIVKSLSQCIEWSSHYDLPIQKDLLSKCLYIKSLDEEEMNFCLLNIVDP
ncbi:uncharacterized protein AC631_01625 [Debaryomyces fabryi]|uniref:Guanine nucleotide exchange factor LTE1 n=1 Tax=Debaryomyces fabryi TaxID=58627 RepID=A0A0V1Q284_9ASCO|nr:uncharacterized protein AC631_01625 [Debaryomyces fabryi]KSA02638.1 hypothetical protein AC631_01625 [Debaryomyces fabryi]CUM45749.1 unnamed protein product [Debaryomyces fabryi]